jgi:HD-GYP domain-containing protein (c-di-GMP phosphodiesterase class II)
MKMLFIGNDIHVYNLFRLVISTEFGSEVDHVFTTEESIEVFEGGRYEVIIFLLPQDNPQILFDYLKKNDQKIPMLFATDNNNLSNCHQYIGNHPLTGKVSFESSERVICGSIRRLLNVYGRFKKINEGYCSLPMYFFKAIPSFKSDIYIKQDDNKFEKIYSSGESITSDKFSYLKEQGITQLYLKQSAYLETSNSFVDAVRRKIKPSKMRAEHLNMVSSFAIDSVCKLVPELGLKDEVINMASTALNNMTEVMGRDINVKAMMNSVLKGDGYKSEHSLFLSYLCCAIVNETEWKSQQSVQKLTMASFFHDIYLEDCAIDLAISDDFSQHVIPKAMMKKYLNHPAEAVKFLDKLADIPPDVMKIISEHHERPDGSGFPQGRNWRKIFPLAAVFIVAEDFVNSVYAGGKSLDFMHDVLDEMDQKYTQGNFKSIMVALRIAMALPALPNASDKIEPLKEQA